MEVCAGGGEAGEDPRNLVLQEVHDILDHEESDAEVRAYNGAGDDIRLNIGADVVDAEPHELHGHADHDGCLHVTEDDADAHGRQQGLTEAQVRTELVPGAQARPNGEQKCLKHTLYFHIRPLRSRFTDTPQAPLAQS